MRAEIVDGHEISTDDRTVWVNSGKTGGPIARFGPNLIDVHSNDAKWCIDCSDGTGDDETMPVTTLIDWYSFKRSVLEHFELEVPDSFCPPGLRLQIGSLMLDATKENPRWMICRDVFGREPKGWEFGLWVQDRWREFALSLGWSGEPLPFNNSPSCWVFAHMWFEHKKTMSEARIAFDEWLLSGAGAGSFPKEIPR